MFTTLSGLLMRRFATIFIFAAALFSAKGLAQQIPSWAAWRATALEDNRTGLSRDALRRRLGSRAGAISGWATGLIIIKRTPDDTTRDKVSVNARDFTTQLEFPSKMAVEWSLGSYECSTWARRLE